MLSSKTNNELPTNNGANSSQTTRSNGGTQETQNINSQQQVNNKPSDSGPCSFIMGTLVAMDGRFEAIENVEAGDQVVSRDDETWEDGKQAVNATFGEYHESVYEITYVVEGDWFKFNKQVTTTAEHPFMVSSIGWTTASQMLVGDRIVTLDNDFAIIVAIEEKFEPQYAYNFEVDEFHTYAVTEDLLWVHNECALNNGVDDVPEKLDPKTLISRQGRDEMSSSKVKRLRKKMKQDGYDQSQPIEVADANGKLIILDGHHRTQGAIGAGIRKVPVNVNKV